MFLQRIKEKLPGNKLIKLNNLSKQILRIFPFFFAFFNNNYTFMVDQLPVIYIYCFFFLLFNWINSSF